MGRSLRVSCHRDQGLWCCAGVLLGGLDVLVPGTARVNGPGAGPASGGKATDDQQEREQELEQAAGGEEHDSGGGYVPADVGDPEQIADDARPGAARSRRCRARTGSAARASTSPRPASGRARLSRRARKRAARSRATDCGWSGSTRTPPGPRGPPPLSGRSRPASAPVRRAPGPGASPGRPRRRPGR